jgi:DNA-directed RNA polymerase specialized sigma24 family protein
MRSGEDSFEAFVLAHGAELVGFARRLTLDHHRAEDIVQDVLARIGLSWAKVSRVDDLRAYVHKAQIAELLGCREATVRSHARRALLALRAAPTGLTGDGDLTSEGTLR